MGIFLAHTGIKCFCGAGNWGVSVFFVLSGFIMIYSYYGENRIRHASFKSNLLFAKNKIRELYLLHIITTFAMAAVFRIVNNGGISIQGLLMRLVLNALLIQEWFPISRRSINGVSWYLCVTVFLYFIFPYVLVLMESSYNVCVAKKMIILLFLIQVVCGGVIYFVLAYLMGYKTGLEWPVYTFPPIRALDFLIGCNLGYLYLNRNQDAMKTSERSEKYTFYEMFSLIVIIAENICYVKIYFRQTVFDNSGQVPYPERWWIYSVLFTMSSVLIVYVFVLSKGKLSKSLSNRFILYLGNISKYAFLIHFVVLQYIEVVCKKIFGSEFCFQNIGWIKLTFGFLIMIIATQAWMKIIHKKIKVNL